jgi:hypothetical protein
MTEQQPQVVYQQPQPQVVYLTQPHGVYQQPAPQTVVVNNVVQGDGAVNHASHGLLWCCTCGLWTPCWVAACLDLGCQKPCG